MRDKRTLARIRALAIPPAWEDVWICRDARGHLQATGRDARGRKQYLYHADWRSVRDASKFHRMLAFGSALPDLRGRIERDLALPGLPRDRVLAALITDADRRRERFDRNHVAAMREREECREASRVFFQRFDAQQLEGTAGQRTRRPGSLTLHRGHIS